MPHLGNRGFGRFHVVNGGAAIQAEQALITTPDFDPSKYYCITDPLATPLEAGCYSGLALLGYAYEDVTYTGPYDTEGECTAECASCATSISDNFANLDGWSIYYQTGGGTDTVVTVDSGYVYFTKDAGWGEAYMLNLDELCSSDHYAQGTTYEGTGSNYRSGVFARHDGLTSEATHTTYVSITTDGASAYQALLRRDTAGSYSTLWSQSYMYYGSHKLSITGANPATVQLTIGGTLRADLEDSEIDSGVLVGVHGGGNSGVGKMSDFVAETL